MTMRKFFLALSLLGAGLFVACEQTDITPTARCVPKTTWREDVEFVDITNTPERQIERFVAANNMDTIRTASGLVYMIESPGGEIKPTIDSTVSVYYRGYLVNGSIFDQSCDGLPGTFPLKDLIKGWREGIPQLGAGGKMWMLVRPGLGYADNPPPNRGITPETVLVFEIELIAP